MPNKPARRSSKRSSASRKERAASKVNRKHPSPGIKRLFLDIETSPNIVTAWSAGYDQHIDHNNIIKERAIICICYKWEGQSRVESIQWDNNQDDKGALKGIIEVLKESDEIVMHNGDRFDLRWIRTRALLYGFSMAPSYNTVDTLKVARAKFKFNSNRLDYIGKYLSEGRKLKTGFDLWKEVVLKNDRKALGSMVQYCKQDVLLLEKVYNRIKNHITPKSHAGVMKGKERGSCPECASESLIINKIRTRATGTKVITFHCNNCGKYHQQPLKNVKDN